MKAVSICMIFWEIKLIGSYDGVVVSTFDFHHSDRGSNPGRGSKFHVYDYTIERHPWQVSENHKPLVHLAMWGKLGSQMGTWWKTRLSYSCT